MIQSDSPPNKQTGAVENSADFLPAAENDQPRTEPSPLRNFPPGWIGDLVTGDLATVKPPQSPAEDGPLVAEIQVGRYRIDLNLLGTDAEAEGFCTWLSVGHSSGGHFCVDWESTQNRNTYLNPVLGLLSELDGAIRSEIIDVSPDLDVERDEEDERDRLAELLRADEDIRTQLQAAAALLRVRYPLAV